jgi:hydroxymethylpyrimidine pyrophosphatase-like HAD family hydrolase
VSDTIRLVATDLDGTLLDDRSRIPERTRRALQAAHGAGIVVIPATGRPPQALWPVVDGFHFGPMAVCSNGAVLVDIPRRENLEVSRLAGHAAADLVGRLRIAIPEIIFAVDDLERFAHESAFFDGPVDWNEAMLMVDDVGVELAEGCVKLIARRPGWLAPELIAQIELHTGDHAGVTTSGLDWVDIGVSGVTKAYALERLCARLGITADQVAAVGDNHNDLALLEWAGVAMAPANAIPEVLALVDRILPANTEEGVADLLEELVGGGRPG